MIRTPVRATFTALRVDAALEVLACKCRRLVVVGKCVGRGARLLQVLSPRLHHVHPFWVDTYALRNRRRQDARILPVRAATHGGVRARGVSGLREGSSVATVNVGALAVGNGITAVVRKVVRKLARRPSAGTSSTSAHLY